MKEKLKNQNAITLIALVVTIVVLLILAGITINMVFSNNGVIKQAQDAKNVQQNAEAKDREAVDELMNQMNGILNGGTTQKQVTALYSTAANGNEEVYDKYGNKIVVPDGFYVVDATKTTNVTYAYDKENNVSTGSPVVQDGIVITDSINASGVSNGNEFVWVPIGTIYNNSDQTSSNTIDLARYSFDLGSYNNTTKTYSGTGAAIAEQKVTLTGTTNTTNKIYKVSDLTNSNAVTIESYYKELVTTEESRQTIAKGTTTYPGIQYFLTSSLTNGGYYLARYEAAEGAAGQSTGIKSISGTKPKSSIIQSEAATLAQNMYDSVNYESDLVNSYAWDTAIVFIQTYGTGINSSAYSKYNMGPTSGTVNTGASSDKYCNIFDMSGNYQEWSSEYSIATGSTQIHPCCLRGGYRGVNFHTTASRYHEFNTIAEIYSFRSTIYIAL